MALADGRTHVLLGIPFDRSVLGPFFQAVLQTITDDTDVPGLRRMKVTPLLAPGAVIHLQRSHMIQCARADASVDFLVMVDSDQVFAPLVVRRLVGWNVPVVAPVIVQRLGDPIPVAYQEVSQDATGCWRYEPQTAPIYAYLSQFRDEWWGNNGSTAVLPLQPDHAPRTRVVPPAIRDGLHQPLLPVDAVGGGMVCLRRDVLETLEPDQQGRFCSFDQGGEDFDLCRRIRAAGWGGCAAGPRGWGIYLDRGCLVGHLLFYARGADDLMVWLESNAIAAQAKDAHLPPAVPDLTDRLRRERELAKQPPWLPDAAARRSPPTGVAAAYADAHADAVPLPMDGVAALPVWADVALPAEAALVGAGRDHRRPSSGAATGG